MPPLTSSVAPVIYRPRWLTIELMLMILPERCLRMIAIASRLQRNMLVRLVLMIKFQSSSDVANISWSLEVPALFTRISRRLNYFMISVNGCFADFSSETSV